jgi:hypothetical protein
MSIASGHRITRAKRRHEEGEGLVTGEPDVAVVGKSGDGFELNDSAEEDEEEIIDGLVPEEFCGYLKSLGSI